MTDLPAFIDEHTITISASRERVWEVLRPYVAGLGAPTGGPLARPARLLWAPEPASGFLIAVERPCEEIVLEGRHRFSRYRLAFELGGGPGGATTLTARSFGDFPGSLGGIYRALVVGSRGHVLAVRHMLRTVRSRVSEPGSS